MSFSQDIKNELCTAKYVCDKCHMAMLYGMLFGSRSVTQDAITINTECKAAADFFAEGIADRTGAIVTIHISEQKKKNYMYTVEVESQDDRDKVYMMFFINSVVDKNNIDFSDLGHPCCALAFLRGVFLVAGTMLDPKKEYHLEFNISHLSACVEIVGILDDFDIEFKITEKSNGFIAYAKESKQIEDTLTCMGAVRASLKLMNLKIEKDLRNKVNRRTNCETANIGKTVNASMVQIEKIEYIKNTMGFENISSELKAAAELRLSNPEASLTELCAIANEHSNTISKSGLNHRLRRLCSIADNHMKDV